MAAKKEQNAVPRSEDEKAKTLELLLAEVQRFLTLSLARSLAHLLSVCVPLTHSLALPLTSADGGLALYH